MATLTKVEAQEIMTAINGRVKELANAVENAERRCDTYVLDDLRGMLSTATSARDKIEEALRRILA